MKAKKKSRRPKELIDFRRNVGKTEARDKTLMARERVLREAQRKGVISNDRARAIGGWQQAWYHLAAMARDGMLKRAGYNQWMPAKRR